MDGKKWKGILIEGSERMREDKKKKESSDR